MNYVLIRRFFLQFIYLKNIFYLNVTALAHVAESTLAGTMSSAAAATARQVHPDSALVW
jgi:hypothetical protein